MPSQKSTKPKSRVSSRSKKGGFKFRWWMALLLVLIVGGVGFTVFRQSFAAKNCARTARGAVCGDGPSLASVGYDSDSTLDIKIQRPYREGFVTLHSGTKTQSDAIFRFHGVNTECGRISARNPFEYKRSPEYMSFRRLSGAIGLNSYWVWWTPVGC